MPDSTALAVRASTSAHGPLCEIIVSTAADGDSNMILERGAPLAVAVAFDVHGPLCDVTISYTAAGVVQTRRGLQRILSLTVGFLETAHTTATTPTGVVADLGGEGQVSQAGLGVLTVTAYPPAAGSRGLVITAAEPVIATRAAAGARGLFTGAPAVITAIPAAQGARVITGGASLAVTATRQGGGTFRESAGSSLAVTAGITAAGTLSQPDTAKIGVFTFPINGFNIYRDINYLVVYTRPTYTATPTNLYGVESVVNSTTGVVQSQNNRIGNNDANPTPIPVGCYVLSGHGGQGGSPAGQWVLDHATPGAVVELLYAGGASSGTGGATTGVTVTPTAAGISSGGGSTEVWEIWHHAWSGPSLRNWPVDVQALTNRVVLAIAQSGGAGTGILTYAPYNGQTVAEHAADIRSFVAAGKVVALGIGGSSDGGITIQANWQADQTFTSIAGYVTTYGINGIDLDLEPSGSSWAEAPIVYLCGRLKSTYGPGFSIGLTPGLYGAYTAQWMSLARALGTNYDYMAPMLYDFPEAQDSRLTAVALDKCLSMANGGVPDNKMVLGFMLRPDSSYTNATPNTQLLIDAYNACKAARPTLQGAYIWEDWIESTHSWWGTRDLGALIRG